MRADVENQKKPLIQVEEVQTKELENALNDDNVDKLQRELKQSCQAVLGPMPDHPTCFGTALHFAVEKKAEKCFPLLLKTPAGQTILDAPNHEGQTPLLLAVAEANPKMVKWLLDVGANANARDQNGKTPLHLLVHSLSIKEKPSNVNNLLEMTDLLLANEKIDLEAHALRRTPLAFATNKLAQMDGDSRSEGLLTFCKKLVERGASLQEKATDKVSVEEVLKKNQALTSVLRVKRSPAPDRPAPSQFLDLIYEDVPADEMEEFLSNRSETEAEAVSNTLLGKYSVLFWVVKAKNELGVKILLKYKANPGKVEITDELPLHHAAALGHKPIFDLLLEKMKGESQKVDLQKHTVSLMQKLMENWKKEDQASSDISHAKCFDRLLEVDVDLDINQELIGNTAVHVAASFNKQEAVIKLLQHGAYLGARPWMTNDKQTPSVLSKLKEKTLLDAMDGCIKHLPHNKQGEDEAITNETYTLMLDYRFLLPSQDTNKGVSEVETLMNISSSRQHRHVITHPLVQTLLYAKWRKALPFYLINLFLYFSFVVFLTAFVYQLKDLLLLQAIAESLDQANTTNSNIEHKRSTVVGIEVVLLLLTSYMLVREIFQGWFSPDQYWKNIENYLECILIVMVFLLCFFTFNVDVTRHLSAWAMIAAWYEFVLILGRAPPLALYITMLRHVSWNFLKFIVLFGALILAFTISFNILLQHPLSDSDGNPEFQDFGSTLPKAIVMSTGEFEYSSLREHFSSNIFAFASTVFMFLIFLFLIFLVLMNVMNALAVTDIKDVMDDATLYSLMSRLELVYLIESLFLRCPPKFKSHLDALGHLQLISGPDNSCRLLAKINKINKKERLWAGRVSEVANKNNEKDLSPNKLDGDTTNCLRNHRLAHLAALEAEEQKNRNDSMLRVEALLRKVVEENPKEIRQKIAGVNQ